MQKHDTMAPDCHSRKPTAALTACTPGTRADQSTIFWFNEERIMQNKPRTPEETYGPALEKAQLEFPRLQPHETAERAGVVYQAGDAAGGGRFEIPFLGTRYYTHWPEGTVQRAEDLEQADIATRILLLHYLLTADGTPVASRWIAFRNLPGGLGYEPAFRQRASLRLSRAFGTDQASFEGAARALGGERLTFGDASFLFRVLPRVWLSVVVHLADEEFPASANVLFDAAVDRYLPTEDLAVVGGLLAARLIRAAQTR